MDRFHVASTRSIAGDFTHGRGPTAAPTGPLGLPQGPAESPAPCRPTPTPRPVAAASARTRPLGPIRVRRPPTQPTARRRRRPAGRVPASTTEQRRAMWRSMSGPLSPQVRFLGDSFSCTLSFGRGWGAALTGSFDPSPIMDQKFRSSPLVLNPKGFMMRLRNSTITNGVTIRWHKGSWHSSTRRRRSLRV